MMPIFSHIQITLPLFLDAGLIKTSLGSLLGTKKLLKHFWAIVSKSSSQANANKANPVVVQRHVITFQFLYLPGISPGVQMSIETTSKGPLQGSA